MKNKYNRGFTLVELLAVIAILGIVVSITVYVGIKSVNSAKEKSYKATKNNIENIASNYLKENEDRLFYISKNDGTDIEYQCITIENLIDVGYFKEDVLNSLVSKDHKVNKSDYIYLERNSTTKSVIKNIYVLNGEDNGVCPKAVKAEEDISFIVSPLEWSKTKDITITYKLRNANNVNDYEYEYSYSNKDKIELISDGGNVKKVKVSDNGTLKGIIKYLKKESYSKDLKIDKIDNIAPSKPIISNPSNGNWTNKNIKLILSTEENGSGVDYWQYTYNDNASSTGTNSSTDWVTYDKSSSTNYTTPDFSQERNQLVYVRACDKVGNCSKTSSTYIRIDKTSPNKPIISNPSNGNWTNNDIKLSLSTEENGSGIDYWQYTYNDNLQDNDWITYDNSSSSEFTTDEFNQEMDKQIYVRACDKTGNCSEVSSTYIRIDKKSPSKPVIDNPSKENWMNKNFSLGLETVENGSGMDYWQYTYNTNSWTNYSNSASNSFTTSPFSQERNQLVYIRACDKAGNCSEVSSTYIRIDKKSPIGNITLSYNSNNKILTASGNVSDALSGFTGIYKWKISTSSTCNNTVSFTSSNTLTVNSSGVYYACARVYDNAGNVSYIRSNSLNVTMSVNIKVYGAIYDNIEVRDVKTNSLVKTVSTNGSGAMDGTLAIKPGKYKFYSTISNHTESVEISEKTTEVGVYPNNSYFWYGNGDNYGESLYKNSGGFTTDSHGEFYCNSGLGCKYSDISESDKCLAKNKKTTRSLYMMGNAQSRGSNYYLIIKSVNGPPSNKKAHIRYKININQKHFRNGNYNWCEYSAKFNGISFSASSNECFGNESNEEGIATPDKDNFYFSFSPIIVNSSCLWVYAIWYE